MNYRLINKCLLLGAILAVWQTEQANAIPVATQDSSSFPYKYEMDVSPTTQDLDSNGTTDFELDASASYSGGIMTQSAGALLAATSSSRIWDSSGITFATGYTIETRTKIVSDTASFPIFGISSNPTGTDANSMLLIRGTGQSWAGAVDLGSNDNTDGFHVYRITQDPGAGSFAVWRDGALLNGSLNSAFNLVLDRFLMGSLSGDVAGSAETDYLRLTPGAYAPVPEPGAYLLMSIGAAALLLLRRKK
ncbi:MAG: PEP-CTERM sorting domain-containing protein [Pirellulales bacterium]|nr:PEP-CTERM sorting domain-containing protein [Pirellulales bacterium]